MMYVLQEMPHEEILLSSGGFVTPLAPLADEYGGVAQICMEDHCYVLYLGGNGRDWEMSSHWFKEAVDALVGLR